MATMTRADTADSLTTEQLIAAATPHRRVYIEAAPGSGKTTVAAQRFGVQRFNGNDQRAVVAVSFTRSATAELRDRVLRRWGRSVLDWPHRVVTLDTIVCELLTHLLHTGHVRWPADHRELTVVDHWRVLLPTRWSDWEPTVVLRTGQVVAQTVRRASKANRPSTDDVRTALSEGYCTHQDARHVFETALAAPGVRDVVRTRLAQTARALIVDEIFDANALDLALVRLAADAGLEVTVVGDPWQALYAFRGARPEEVPALSSGTYTPRFDGGARDKHCWPPNCAQDWARYSSRARPKPRMSLSLCNGRACGRQALMSCPSPTSQPPETFRKQPAPWCSVKSPSVFSVKTPPSTPTLSSPSASTTTRGNACALPFSPSLTTSTARPTQLKSGPPLTRLSPRKPTALSPKGHTPPTLRGWRT
jgi:hypothetical protein